MISELRIDAMDVAKEFQNDLSNSTNTANLKKAENNWNSYTPTPSNKNFYGVDSSHNVAPLENMPIGAADVVSVNKHGNICFKDSVVGVDIHPDVKSTMLECSAVIETLKKYPTVSVGVDGSAYFAASNPLAWNKYSENMEQLLNGQIMFISKSSLSKMVFDGPLTDAYYFATATSSSGFSNPIIDKKYSQAKAITSSFIRLSDNTPLLKLEMIGEHTVDDIKSAINEMSQVIVGGYPYELYLAHQECIIQNTDMDEIISIFGLSANARTREVLN